MAQDFYTAFGLGLDDKHITTIEADGVGLAAIQALYRLHIDIVREKDQQILDQQEVNQRQEAEIDELCQMVEALQQRLAVAVSPVRE